ncbi:hypothetical protein C0J52_05189 [Blattella germanica]|nr:hypothetical protein C0J52_05189 [Blattella germanica]
MLHAAAYLHPAAAAHPYLHKAEPFFLTPGGSADLGAKHCRRRKARTVFSDHQLTGLEKRFEAQRYLSTPERVELANALNLSETQALNIRFFSAGEDLVPEPAYETQETAAETQRRDETRHLGADGHGTYLLPKTWIKDRHQSRWETFPGQKLVLGPNSSLSRSLLKLGKEGIRRAVALITLQETLAQNGPVDFSSRPTSSSQLSGKLAAIGGANSESDEDEIDIVGEHHTPSAGSQPMLV